MTMTRATCAGGAERGVTMIEVLVAVLIVSFGLLGLVGLQSRAVTYSVGAEDSNRAALVANDITTALKLNLTNVGKLDATNAKVLAAVAAASGQLPSGSAVVTPAASAPDTTVTIKVYWKPTTASTTAASNAYTTQVVVP